MLVVTVSRRREGGRIEPLLAVSDPRIVHQVLRSVCRLTAEEDNPGGSAQVLASPDATKDKGENSDG